MTELYWIEGPWKGRLAVAPRPRGGDWLQDEVVAWKNSGITQVVSLLTSGENAQLDLNAEQSACDRAGISFASFPIEDRGTPADSAAATQFVHKLDADLRRGESVLIHCRQGVGRAGMIAAGILIDRGVDAIVAVKEVSASRGVPVPETDEQREWIRELAARVGNHGSEKPDRMVRPDANAVIRTRAH